MATATAHAGYIFQVLPDKTDYLSDQKSQARPDFRHYGRMTWPSTKFMLSSMQSSYKIQLALQSHNVRKLMILLGQSYSLPRRQVEHTWIMPAPGSAWVLSLSKKHGAFFVFP